MIIYLRTIFSVTIIIDEVTSLFTSANKIMEEEHKKEHTTFKTRHFAKLHERIQNKYDEMQKKLEKSKSVDSIPMLKDEFNYTERHSSTDDLRECEYENKRHSVSQSIILEEAVVTKNASFQDFETQDSVSELVDEFLIIDKQDVDDVKVENNNFFGSEFTNISHESLNNINVESDGAVTPTSPSPKISIRDRISLRISAAKERRRKTENLTKDKKKEARQKVEKLVLSNTTKHETVKASKKTRAATVSIALIEANVIDTELSEEKSNFYCRFKFGTEKYKSKLIKNHGNEMKWQELFSLNMFEEYALEISLWDKDVLMGRTIIDLFELEKEKTHKLRLNLECDMGHIKLFILLTISGTSTVNTLVDVDDYQEMQRRTSVMRKQFAWYRIKSNTDEVGKLSVIVYGAKGLSAQECYCVLELDNERLQTHTEFKTTEPNWMKVFTFTVNDVSSILDITVHDNKRSEDIGKVSIPLLDIKNGVKKWYALKEVTQRDRAKGNNPRILLEMGISWNLFRAAVRVINPKETKYLELEEKLQRHTFTRNLSRAKAVLAWIKYAFGVLKTCFEWESRKSNVIALTLWLLFCWFFKMWMLPLLVLVPFIWYKPEYVNRRNRYLNKQTSLDIEDSKSKEEKTTLRQKINSLQEMVQSVQNFIGNFASLGESIKNLFNFSVPFLSYLAIFIILVITLVMFLIPVKYIFMTWGIHKFMRKILRPNRIPNNEILDLLSRVPDDEILLNIKELPLEETPDDEDEMK